MDVAAEWHAARRIWQLLFDRKEKGRVIQIHSLFYTTHTVSYSSSMLCLDLSIYARLSLLYLSQIPVSLVQFRSSATSETMEDRCQNHKHNCCANNSLSSSVSGLSDSMIRSLMASARSSILQYSASSVPSRRIETAGDSDAVP